MRRIRRSHLFMFSFLLLGLYAFVWPTSSEISAQDMELAASTDAICTVSNEAFIVGEKITYKVYYNLNFIWIPAARVTFEVKDLGDQYHLYAEGRTLKTYDWIFKVRDYYEVFVDKKTLLPTRAIRQVREGGYRLYDEMHFDRDRNMVSSLRGKTKEKATMMEYPIEACTHDILSIIYYARNLDFQNYQSGEKFPVDIFMDKEQWGLNVLYKGVQENKKIKGQGKFDTYLFHPEVISGDVFDENTVMNVFVSKDGNRIPLLIESPISVGSIKAVLDTSEGLRHEVQARRP